MNTDWSPALIERARLHAALGEPARLAIVNLLSLGDASPSELGKALGLPSNLLAHQVKSLEQAGLLERSRSEGDHRRTYSSLKASALSDLTPTGARTASRTAHVLDIVRPDDLIVAVCDNAHEQLADADRLHLSVPDPASAGTDEAFERAFRDLAARVERLAPAVHPLGDNDE